MPLNPEVLLVSSKYDYTTDHIVCELEHRGARFLRLNRDEFSEMSLCLTLSPLQLEVTLNGEQYLIDDDTLKGVYFRAPVFLRENPDKLLTADEQFARQQWSAFIRALSVFTNAIWINPIAATFAAEVKPFQLVTALRLGFLTPMTLITNFASKAALACTDDVLAVKTLDSAVLDFGPSTEGFVYTNIITKQELLQSSISTAPIIAQQPIAPKLDIRVTVVGQTAFAVAITDQAEKGFQGDWRLEKDRIQYAVYELPEHIARLCTTLVDRLGLTFGGIDLAKSDGEYYFIEVNPTGEWAWLAATLGLPIAQAICGQLLADS